MDDIEFNGSILKYIGSYKLIPEFDIMLNQKLFEEYVLLHPNNFKGFNHTNTSIKNINGYLHIWKEIISKSDQKVVNKWLAHRANMTVKTFNRI